MVDLTKVEKRLIRIALASLLDDCTKANQLMTRPEDKVDLSPIQSLLLKFDENTRPEKTQEDASGDVQPEFPWRVKP
jgi:hypothetical protein